MADQYLCFTSDEGIDPAIGSSAAYACTHCV